MKSKIINDSIFVWPDISGVKIGQSIEPLYDNQVNAAKYDLFLYEVLAMIDMLRVGKSRDRLIALNQLKKMLDK